MRASRGASEKRGQGFWRVIEQLPDWRGTTVQVCGLWPFSKGKGVPVWGVPLGKEQESGVAVAGDPATYFTTNLIPNPSCWIQGSPGLGKSSLTCRIIVGLEGFGIPSLVLGDVKGEYVATITALGGQVLDMGRSKGHINVLDHEYAVKAANLTDADGNYLLSPDQRDQLLNDAVGRRKTGIESLINILRKKPPTEIESSILETALEVLFAEWTGAKCPRIKDLLDVITPQETPDGPYVHGDIRAAALDDGSMKDYRKTTRALRGTLQTLSKNTGLGAMFSQDTDIEPDLTRSLVFNAAGLQGDMSSQAAALLACWNLGFGMIETQQVLADAGVIPRRNYNVVVDELWRPLQAGQGMVDRFSASTRLNRSQGISIIFVTHSLTDLSGMTDRGDRAKAEGIAQRCGMHIYFGVPKTELALIQVITPLTVREQFDLASWSTPGTFDQRLGRQADPPGMGKCLIKIQGQRGIRVQVTLTEEEIHLHDTNQRWAAKAHQSAMSK